MRIPLNGPGKHSARIWARVLGVSACKDHSGYSGRHRQRGSGEMKPFIITLALAALACGFQPLPVSQAPHTQPKAAELQTLTGTPYCVATVNTTRGTDGKLNFRAGPGTEFRVNTVLAEGET